MGQRVLRREDSRFLRGEGQLRREPRPARRAARDLRPLAVRARPHRGRSTPRRARALPGTQVFTAADVDLGTFQPPPFPGLDQRMGRPFLAGEVVRFAGDIVAVVRHRDARRRRRRRRARRRRLRPAAGRGRPRAGARGRRAALPGGRHQRLHEPPGRADEALFDGCDTVVSGRLVSQRLAASPLEPRGCAAVVGDDGRLTLWLSTQTPHQDRDGLAMSLGLDAGRRARRRAGRRRRLRRQDARRRGDPRRVARTPDWTSGALDRDARREHGRDAPRSRRRPRLHDRWEPGRRSPGLPSAHPPGRRRLSAHRSVPARLHGADVERRVRDPEDRGRVHVRRHEHDADRPVPRRGPAGGDAGDRAGDRPLRRRDRARPRRGAPPQPHRRPTLSR